MITENEPNDDPTSATLAARELQTLHEHLAELSNAARRYMHATAAREQSPHDIPIARHYRRCSDALIDALNRAEDAP